MLPRCLAVGIFVFLWSKKRDWIFQHFCDHPKRGVLKARRGNSESMVSKCSRTVLSGRTADRALCSESNFPLVKNLLGLLIPAKSARVGEAIF
jgi:hypothetical protein